MLFRVIGTATGCATHGQWMRDARAACHQSDLAAAERALEQQQAGGRQCRLHHGGGAHAP